MIVRNTSAYPDDEVRELVFFAVGRVNMSKVCVNVKGGRHGRGMAYHGVPSISNAPPSCEYLVTATLPDPFKPHMSSYRGRSGGRWPESTLIVDWREWAVWLIAHEAKHIDQFKAGTRQSEVACEHYAAFMLRKHREREEKAA